MDSKKKTNIDEQVDDLVDYIDNFMGKKNAGHMNITVNNEGKVNKEEIFVDNTGNCVNSACKCPTLFEGLDDPEEEN